MATDFCCGCTFIDDYGTSTVDGTGSSADPFKVSLIDPGFIRPVVRVLRAVDQSITTDTPTVISFDTEIFDSDNLWDSGSPTRLTINTGGLYLMGACGNWSANSSETVREFTFRANGITNLNSQDIKPNNAIAALGQEASYLWFFQPGEYVELVVRHESGVNMDLWGVAPYSIVFWMCYVGKKV